MSAPHVVPVYRRSSFCQEGCCVEVAVVAGGDVLVRDSKSGPDGSTLRFTALEWVDFVGRIKAGGSA